MEHLDKDTLFGGLILAGVGGYLTSVNTALGGILALVGGAIAAYSFFPLKSEKT